MSLGLGGDPIDEGAGPVLLVGLTGGIATGKSTVSGMFRELGVPVVDADAIVHELLDAGGPAVEPVVAAFGEGVRAADRGIDRAKLAESIFRDEPARRQLEQIVHPMVVTQSRGALAAAVRETGADLVIYDAALLVETGRHREFHRVVVVVTSAEIQLARLAARDSLDVERAGARIRSQLPMAQKAAVADYLVDNSGHWIDTRRQVGEVLRQLHEDARLLRAGQALPRRRAVSDLP